MHDLTPVYIQRYLRVRQHHIDIYSENFLGETQGVPKRFLPEDERSSGKGLESPFTQSPYRMNDRQLHVLMDPMAGL